MTPVLVGSVGVGSVGVGFVSCGRQASSACYPNFATGSEAATYYRQQWLESNRA